MNPELNTVPPIEILKGLHTQQNQANFRLTYQWRSGLGGIGSLVTEVILFLIGVAFLLPTVASLLNAAKSDAANNLFSICSSLLFGLLGLLLVYRGLGYMFNHTRIEITPEAFTSHSAPIPFLGENNLTIPRHQVTEVEWKKEVRPGKQRAGKIRSAPSTTYNVVVTTTDGEARKVLSGMNDSQYAFAIQGEIARFLNPHS